MQAIRQPNEYFVSFIIVKIKQPSPFVNPEIKGSNSMQMED